MEIQCPKCYTINNEDSHFCSKCGYALEESQATLSYEGSDDAPEIFPQFKAGDYFDNRYRIIEEIGRGGMGSVYKAEDTKLNITVALKLIRPKLATNPVFVERFKKETLTARSISQENVIRIYDLGEMNETKYISMEYIKGQNLSDLIHASGNLSIETAVNITKQICAGLKAAHKKSIIHRDLKSSNIMVDLKGQAYVMDFGLAKSVHISESEKPGPRAGTPPNMSPEQILGEKLDHRSDIYSLGIIMYEMLTGRQPFEAEKKEEYFQKHLKEKPIPPSRINPRIPFQLEAIILKCLAKERERRYLSVDQIVAELDQQTRHDQKSILAWIKDLWYLVLFGILALSLTVGYILLKKEPTILSEEGKKLSLAIMYLTNDTGDSGLDYLGKSICELLIADLLQSRQIRTITGDRIYGILKSLNLLDSIKYSDEDLKKVASKAGVDGLIQGNITKSGDIIRINTTLHQGKNLELIGTQRVEGRGEESLFSLADGLTRQIKEDFRLSSQEIAQDIDKDVINITTDSPQALMYYVEGKLLHADRKFEESIRALEKAIEFDPEFALAYVKIAENYFYLMDEDKGDEYLGKALSVLNKVSDREFYLIQAFAADSPQEKIAYYQKLLALYPDDLSGNGYLASLYRNIEEWDLSQKHFERIIEIDPYDQLTLENLAHINKAKGRYGKAREILESQQEIFPNPIHFHMSMAMAYFCEGKPEPAMDQINEALTFEPENIFVCELKGHIHQIKGEYDLAEKCYRKLINEGSLIDQSLGRLWLCHMYLMLCDEKNMRAEMEKGIKHSQKNNFPSGLFNMWLLDTYYLLQNHQSQKAFEASNNALEISVDTGYPEPKNFALHFQGLVYIQLGKLEQAKKTAEELKLQIEESIYSKNMRHYHHLMGEIAQAENNISRAIDCFKTASSLLSDQYSQYDPQILFFYSLASAYYEDRDWDKAQEEYEKIASLTTGRLRWGDKYVLSFYKLGKIYQIQRENQKAATNYQKFLSHWKSVDPKPKEMLDAEKQLSILLAADK